MQLNKLINAFFQAGLSKAQVLILLIFCQVGPGEGVVNLRASAVPMKGLKINSAAKSSWKLTVDAVQVAESVFSAGEIITFWSTLSS